MIRPTNIPYYSSQSVEAAMPVSQAVDLIRMAYVNYYDPSNPPQKYSFQSSNGCCTLLMPYLNPDDGMYCEKTLFIEKERRPSISGYVSVFDLSKGQCLAVMDATSMTGMRTAAKSLLFSKLYYDNNKSIIPNAIYVYGSSTQAYYHCKYFGTYYPSASIYSIVRNGPGLERMSKRLEGSPFRYRVVTNDHSIGDDPNVIITATSSAEPLITYQNLRSAALLVAVGSSSGQNTEIDSKVVAQCDRYVDAKISVSGKGEYNLPITRGEISIESIRELRDVILGGTSCLFGHNAPTLFVSKGLIIEDYLFVMRLLRMK